MMSHYGIDQLRESMVKILNPTNAETVGSGFIIRTDGYLITCHHVIYLLAALSVEYRGEIYQAQWCEEFSDPEVDIAILKIDVKGAKAVPIINPQRLSTSVVVYGFPNSKKDNFPQGFDVSAKSICQSAPLRTASTYPSDAVKFSNPWNKLPQPKSMFESYRINARVDRGTSGGPVLAEALGGTIGIVQCGYSGKDETYVIRWENINKQLEQLGIRKTETLPPRKLESPIFKDQPKSEEDVVLLDFPITPTISKEVDCTKLQELLKAQQWKDADYETYLVMLQAVEREEGDWIRTSQLASFPCEILYTIDQLWTEYSKDKFGKEKFGFSIQQQVWRAIGGKPGGFDIAIFRKFKDCVGWQQNKNLLAYNQFTFDLDARDGHLPSLGYGVLRPNRWSESIQAFLPRAGVCFS
jgi:hypothetical protein